MENPPERLPPVVKGTLATTAGSATLPLSLPLAVQATRHRLPATNPRFYKGLLPLHERHSQSLRKRPSSCHARYFGWQTRTWLMTTPGSSAARTSGGRAVSSQTTSALASASPVVGYTPAATSRRPGTIRTRVKSSGRRRPDLTNGSSENTWPQFRARWQPARIVNVVAACNSACTAHTGYWCARLYCTIQHAVSHYRHGAPRRRRRSWHTLPT